MGDTNQQINISKNPTKHYLCVKMDKRGIDFQKMEGVLKNDKILTCQTQ